MSSTAVDSLWSSAIEERRRHNLFRLRLQVDSPQQPLIETGGKQLLSFCSNDYLGLANHPAVKKAFTDGVERYGVGSGASHLVSGHSRAHEELEEALAAFTGRDRVVLFSSGYMANIGVLTCLAGQGDTVFEDRLNHASLLDGGLFSAARFRRYHHVDTAHLENLLARHVPENGKAIVVTDGVFSMDGDVAPVPQLADLVARYQGLLMVDDAHGFGCLGSTGGGSLAWFSEQGQSLDQDNCQILVGTLGKAFGTAGAFVAGSEALVETLVQFCRPYIYTTAQPAALACATLKSLELIQREPERRVWLAEMIARFRNRCAENGLRLTDSTTPIQGLLLGSETSALAASRFMTDQGFLVTAIRPPTVPKGTSRLRFTFSAAHTEQQFSHLLGAMDGLAEMVSP